MTEAGGQRAGLRSRSLAFVLDYIWIGSYLALLVVVGVLADKAWPRVVQVLFGGPLIGKPPDSCSSPCPSACTSLYQGVDPPGHVGRAT